MTSHGCSTLNRWVQKVKIFNIVHFPRNCSSKSQTELLTSMEVLRIKPVPFYSSLPQQTFSTLVYFTLYCYLIPSHTWVSSCQWNCQVIKSRLFGLFCWCLLKHQTYHQHILGSKVTALLNQGLGSWSLSVNSVLLDTAIPIHLSDVCGCFHATTTEVSPCNRTYCLQIPEILTIRPLPTLYWTAYSSWEIAKE